MHYEANCGYVEALVDTKMLTTMGEDHFSLDFLEFVAMGQVLMKQGWHLLHICGKEQFNNLDSVRWLMCDGSDFFPTPSYF